MHVYDAPHDREAMAGWLAAFDQPAAGGTARVAPAARARPRHRGALDAVLRRAVQLLPGLRRRRAAEGVPQGDARREPRHRGAPGADRGRVDPRRRTSTAGSRSPTTAARPSSWRCCSSSCAPPPTAGSRRWRACATCSPRPTSTPTRWGATSRARRPAWASRSPRCTRSSPSTSPPHVRTAEQQAELADAMTDRLDAALDVVPELAEYADGLRATFAAVADVAGVAGAAGARRPPPRPDPAHRQGLEDRRLRGRARQAARRAGRCPTPRGVTSPACCGPSTTPRAWPSDGGRARDDTGAEQRAYRAAEWADRNCDGLPVGVRRPRAAPPTSRRCSTRYVADKAVYEAVYEARNRPTWVPVPLAAIERLAG